MVEAGRPARRRRAAARLPGVQADVVVVAAGRDEGGLVAEPAGELEAEHAVVERQRAVEVGDLEVDVADVRAAGRASGGSSFRDSGVVAMIVSRSREVCEAGIRRRSGAGLLADEDPVQRRADRRRSRARRGAVRGGRRDRPRSAGAASRSASRPPWVRPAYTTRRSLWQAARSTSPRSASLSTSRVTPLLLSARERLTSTMRRRCSGASDSRMSSSMSSGASPCSGASSADSDARTTSVTRTRLAQSSSAALSAPVAAPSLHSSRLLAICASLGVSVRYLPVMILVSAIVVDTTISVETTSRLWAETRAQGESPWTSRSSERAR